MASRKVILVTGGNSGIGYEAVKAFLQSQKPYHILLGSRSAEKGKFAVESLNKEVPESKNTVEVLEVDLESDDSIEKAFEQVKKSPGSLDALVNNAGKFCPFKIASLRQFTGFDRLTPNRRFIGPRMDSWEDIPPRMLQQGLQRKCNWHTHHVLDLHAPPP